jgi:hypothetical protein
MPITKSQVQHAGRFLKQVIRPVQVGVIGGYHGINLGDIALGESVSNVLTQRGISNGLQTIYNLEKWNWPKAPYAIIGGGACGYDNSMSRVARRYRNDFNKVALLGVDFMEDKYSSESMDLMCGATWISCRSEKQADKITVLTGRTDVQFHPDLAFSLEKQLCSDQRKKGVSDKTKTLLVNIVPVYGVIEAGKIVPSKEYMSERPDLYKNYDIMQQSYKQATRTLVSEALAKGYVVETIAFTPEDEVSAQIILETLPVKHVKYNPDTKVMLRRIAKAEWIFSTRYHATIFALKMGAKITPMAYATKNELLLKELGVSRSDFLASQDFAEGATVFPDRIFIEDNVVDKWETESDRAIQKCIDTLIQNK